LEISRCSVDLVFRSAARSRWTRKSRGPKNQVALPFLGPSFCLSWAAERLSMLRTELDFRILGYVLVPEHCHLLIWPGPPANPAQVMQKL
jgi:hypothetical protein